MGARALRCIGFALAALGCASPVEIRVEACAPPAERPPLAAASCVDDPGGNRHAGRAVALIGEVLSGWHSHPGAAEISVAFGDDGRVASVCFDSVSGGVVARRVPDLAERARELPPAPACLAGRRLDFDWESGVATSEDVRLAVRACHRRIHPLKQSIEWCWFRQHCSATELADLRSEADRELRSCVLESVPLTMSAGLSREAIAFLPSAGRKPDPELAVRAHRVCDGLPRPEDVIECMDRHGWRRAR